MLHQNYTKIACVGVGGKAVYSLAKYFRFLGTEVLGFDISENKRTQALEKLGVAVKYENPAGFLGNDIDLIIYSNSLPNQLIKTLKENNTHAKCVAVGELYQQIVSEYTAGHLGEQEKQAVEKTNLTPLLNLNTQNLVLIGVTGTDGKTTTCCMLYGILKAAGYRTGMINTVGARINDRQVDTGLHVTTPSAQEIARLICKMQKEKCTHIVLECTSHALVTGRLAGLKLDFAVFTNITKEHLDFHGNMGNLIAAKSLLVKKHLKNSGFAVINLDDELVFNRMKSLARNEIFYSTRSTRKNLKHLVTAKNIQSHGNESFCFNVEIKLGREKTSFKQPVCIPMIGAYNVSNALAALSVGCLLDIEEKKVVRGLKNMDRVPGRTEVLQKEPFYVIIDFAHTPNGLKNVLASVAKLKKSKKNKLLVVFGCAGKRDPSKRSPMGQIAARYADVTILTAEDPRTESLKKINDAIEKGWRSTASDHQEIIRYDDTLENVLVRQNAIKKALCLAQEGDVVIICGKAHEKSLCF
ncbi:hypothetical protein B5M47_03300, partial [candidate division CPR3 bacterium 4484_211]